MLSHRLRGFGRFENSAAALRAACASSVPWLELDTRVSLDGEVFVYHDAKEFSSSPGSTLRAIRYPDGDPLLTLQVALQLFGEWSRPAQTLCIDIKDAGFESVHLNLVRDAGLEARVAFVSWMPQTILKLHDLATTAPLILSYFSLLDLGIAGTGMDRWITRRRYRMGNFAAMGSETATEPLGALAHGFQHGLLCRQLPSTVVNALRTSRGGVCVHRWFLGPQLFRYCSGTGLQLWTFSVRTPPEYIRFASQPEIDVVFCDDAPAVTREIAAKQLR